MRLEISAAVCDRRQMKRKAAPEWRRHSWSQSVDYGVLAPPEVDEFVFAEFAPEPAEPDDPDDPG
jgi:hypothetical protein